MNYSARGQELMQEVLHRFGTKLLIDLSVQDSGWGAAALNRGIPFLGVCFNASHVRSLALHSIHVLITTKPIQLALSVKQNDLLSDA
jgi:hypothetical protein